MEKSPKKWSLGSILFRKNKKPQADFSSDEDDSKAGFGDDFVNKSATKGKRSKSHEKAQYAVANPEFYYIKPSSYQVQCQDIMQQHAPQQSSLEFINNQLNLDKNRGDKSQFIYSNGSYHLQQYQGSSQDEKSSYNSMSSPICKDGSETGSRTSLNKRTRNARNERYYQRIMREEGRPLTIYGSLNSAQNRLSTSKKSSSLCSSDLMLPSNMQAQSLPIPFYRGNPIEDKDDYENIHEIYDSVPPPIPPRDPNRRFSINSSSISQQPYYFDHTLQKYVVFNTNGKCVSDDRLWSKENDVNSARRTKNGTQQQDILRPRSRKPLNVHTNLDKEFVFSSEDYVDGSRPSLSQQSRSKSAIDFEKMSNDALRTHYGVRRRNLTSVEPIRYQPPPPTTQELGLEALRKKYSSAEDVNNKKASSILLRPPAATTTTKPVFRKSLNVMDLKTTKNSNVSSNLDDAINELELMYKSLVADEGVMMQKYEDYENEENRNDKEPDIVLDDVFSRNLKHANQMLKPSEPLPFGIPNQKLGPIPPKPSQDYLSVEPIQMRKVASVASQNNPDVVADDLAVRNLRKDNPRFSRRHNMIEIDNNHFMKRNHTLSSLSDEIYNGILKGATKPSGGKMDDYLKHDKKTQPEKDRATDFEETLNALVVESKAISKKLEKDWSKLRSSDNQSQPKTMMNLLSFTKSPEREKSTAPSAAVASVVHSKSPVEPPKKPKVKMTSTACSPIKMTSTACSPIKDIDILSQRDVQSKSPKQRAEKIGNLIAMFNTASPPESPSIKKTKIVFDKPLKKISDSCELFNKVVPDVESKQTFRREPSVVRETINLKIVSPTVMKKPSESPKVKSPSSSETSKPHIDVESNINNIKDLIQQIKQTEFDNEQRKEKKHLVAKSPASDMPDYDNIKEDYAMTNGVLKRNKPTPELAMESRSRESFGDDSSAEAQSKTSSSSRHEPSVERTSSESAMSCSAIYKNAVDFLNETTEPKTSVMTSSEHKSPIKTMTEEKDEILSCIQRINKLGSTEKSDDEAAKTNGQRSILKSGGSIPNRSNHHVYEDPPHIAQIQPVVLPKVGPSDTESLYNSCEELTMIFGNAEPAPTAIQPDASFVELQKTLRDATAKFTPSHQSNKPNCSVNSPLSTSNADRDVKRNNAESHKVTHFSSDVFNGARPPLTMEQDDQIVKSNVATPSAKALNTSQSDEKQSDNESSPEVPVEQVKGDDKVELNKPPKGMHGLFPLDLQSELRKRVGGSTRFSLKNSSSNVDIFNKRKENTTPNASPVSDIQKEIRNLRKADGDDDSSEGQENLSFKDKLKLIERSSSKILVNPLSIPKSLAKSKSCSVVPLVPVLPKAKQEHLDEVKKEIKENIDQISEDEDKESMYSGQELAKSSSIADRLALLKSNGENNWRKRVPKAESANDIKKENFISKTTSATKENENELNQQKTSEIKPVEGGKISERLEKIKTNSEKWKKRVEPTDATNFKISTDSFEDPPELPFEKVGKKCPPMKTFKSENIYSAKLSKSTSTVFGTPRSAAKTLNRSLSVNDDPTAPVLRGLKVQLPTLDQGIEAFFPKAEDTIDAIDITDFDEIKIDSKKLSQRKVTQGPKRRRPANAMRVLAHLRTDKIVEYTEMVPDCLSPNESKDSKKSKFTAEALAGLASTEDFTNITLKSNADPLNVTHLPYKSDSPMLVHIKGRRHVECRLVEAKFSNLNDGDCFVLITKEKLFSFIGRYANVVETKICKDFCSSILRDKDLGCSATMLNALTEGNLDGYNGKIFCKILGRKDDEALMNAGHSDEDELIESCLQETNMTYEFDNDELIPVEDFWGHALSISMVDSKKIFVIDFGSELYIWYGKNAMPDDKKIALLLAEEMFEGSYNYENCHLNPIDFSMLCGNRKEKKDIRKKGKKRPEHALLGRVNQNMETVLFRQKFTDWPDIKIKVKNGVQLVDCNEIAKINGGHLYRSWNYEEPNLVLENSNLGRGHFYYDDDTRRHYEINSVSVNKWLSNGDEEALEDHGHFYATEAYNIRWIYQISITVRELSGKISERTTVGRERCVYFNWQGCDSSATERGTSTLLMVKLDEEKGSQLVIHQFQEFPAFLRLFKFLFIHKKRSDESRFDTWRMYLINGCDPSETRVNEVPCEKKNLRSRACMLLIHGQKGRLLLWKGAKTTEQQQKVALDVCSKICGKKPRELYSSDRIRMREHNEGQEDDEFTGIFDETGDAVTIYGSLKESEESFDFTPRMYELTSNNGEFEAIEVIPGLRNKDQASAFPFVQQDLYNARQPSLFIVDNGNKIYLWQGWWPVIEDVDEVDNKACENRWHLERYEAMEATLDYWKAKCGDDEKYRKEAFIVSAGYEPIDFQGIFPEWVVHDDVVEINNESTTKQAVQLDEYFARFNQLIYALEELLQRPLPEYVNPTKLEMYLNDEEFSMTLGMTKDEWKELPQWKKTNLKKEKGLF